MWQALWQAFRSLPLIDGKGLAIGGSQQINQMDPKLNSYYGDVSAVIMIIISFVQAIYFVVF